MTLSNSAISRCLAAYGASPTLAQSEQIRAYISLLLKWNRSISLTTVTDELEILKFHFGESIFGLPHIDGLNGRLADVGSGAGFPGLALCIFADNVDLSLIESNSKKCAFLSEVVRELSLANVRVLRARFEELDEFRGSLTAVLSRALGGYDKLLRWSRGSLAPAGKIILWLGGDDAKEISSKPDWNWEPPVAIPGSKRRFILAGSPLLP